MNQQLEAARVELEAARARFQAAKVGSRKWLAAEEDLNFWQGKVANLAAAAERGL